MNAHSARRRRSMGVATAAALILVVMTLPVPPVGGQTVFSVDHTADEPDSDPGDGVCSTAADSCTLRAAVMEANAGGQPAVVRLPSGTYRLTRDGAGEDGSRTGDLDVLVDLEIEGTGLDTVIRGNGGDRAIHVLSRDAGVDPPTLVLRRLTIEGGDATGPPPDDVGGGIRIEDSGALTLEHVVMTDNVAGSDGGAVFAGRSTEVSVTDSIFLANQAQRPAGEGDGGGGALFAAARARVSIERSEFEQNRADQDGGAVFKADSGTDTDGLPRGQLTIEDSAFNANLGIDDAGALSVNAGNSLTVSNSEFIANRAGDRASDIGINADGGAIEFDAPNGVATILRSRFQGNEANNDGGALAFNGGWTVEISGSVLVGNTGDAGGAVWLAGNVTNEVDIEASEVSANVGRVRGGGLDVAQGHELALRNTTVSGNQSPSGGGVFNAGRAALAFTTVASNDGHGLAGGVGAATFLSHALMGGNAPETCADVTVESSGYNIVDDDSCGALAPDDREVPDIRIGPLAHNGGVTRTHALSPGSPARDGGSDGPCVDGAGGGLVEADQRGRPRPQDGTGDGTARCDVGAVESGAGLDGLVVERIRGPNRIDTAVAVAREGFPSGSGTVVLARADQYADALSGGPLARALGAPILLTARDELPASVAAEIERLGADRAVILGGPSAVAGQVEDELRDAGVGSVERVAGTDRFDTAAQIAGLLGGSQVYVAEGANADPNRGWPDSLAVSALAAFQQRPILLVTTEGLPDASRQVLSGVAEATIVGGTSAVGEAVADQIRDLGVAVDRIAGATRFETSTAVAEIAVEAGLDSALLWLATGGGFADALVAGPIAASEGGVLLLVDGSDLEQSPASRDFIIGEATRARWVRVLGGSAAVSPTVVDQVSAILAQPAG